MQKFFRRLRRDERGAALPEYALLLGLIAAVTATVLTTMGTNINTIFSNVQGTLSTVASK